MTIDVRAPVRGTVRAITVKEEDTVTVGQVVAVLDESDSATAQPAAGSQQIDTAHSQAPARPPQPQAQLQDLDELKDAAHRVSDSAMRGQKARITFPPRKTENGMTISFMPAVDQETYRARGVAAKSKESGRAEQQAQQAQQASQAQAQPGAQRVYLARQLPRMQLSDAEMESINLGGAPP